MCNKCAFKVQKGFKVQCCAFKSFKKRWALSLSKCQGSILRVRLFKCSIVQMFDCSFIQLFNAAHSKGSKVTGTELVEVPGLNAARSIPKTRNLAGFMNT